MHAQLLLIGRENADVQPGWRGRVVNPETGAQLRRRIGNREGSSGFAKAAAGCALAVLPPRSSGLGLGSLTASESRQQRQPRIQFFFFFNLTSPCLLVICPFKTNKVIFFLSSKSTLFRIRQYSKSTKLTSSFQRGRDLSAKSLCNYSIH